MNSNGKTIELFLKSREEKRERAAKASGKEPSSCQYKSVPASRKSKKSIRENLLSLNEARRVLWFIKKGERYDIVNNFFNADTVNWIDSDHGNKYRLVVNTSVYTVSHG